MKLEASLKDKLTRIFDLHTSFDIPSDSREQEKIYVQVDQNRTSIRDGIEVSRVTGRLRIFANSSKLPLGYIAKMIAKASPEDKKDFFFYDVEEVAGTFNSMVERSLGFVFFYSSQYNPERGTMNSINVEVNE
jgi:hypothetical protein